MVLGSIARKDVDELLTKTITYRKFSTNKPDLAYDYIDKEEYTDYKIKAQCNIQREFDKYVMMGIVKQGDMIGLLRYQYDVDADGTAISPALIPKQGDMIYFLGQWFTIKDCTPLTSEDDVIIAWEFTAGRAE